MIRLIDNLRETAWATNHWSLDGHDFIRRSPDDDVNCHEIYRGCSQAELTELNADYDGRLVLQHRAILEIQNGARLFDNGINVYGVRAAIANPGSIGDAGPIRCSDQAYTFRVTDGDLWDLGFRPFGGVVTEVAHTLLISQDGHLWRQVGGQLNRLGDPAEVLSTLVEIWDSCLRQRDEYDAPFPAIEAWLTNPGS